MKISDKSVLAHLQGGNYEFKIVVWTNTKPIYLYLFKLYKNLIANSVFTKYKSP